MSRVSLIPAVLISLVGCAHGDVGLKAQIFAIAEKNLVVENTTEPR